MRAVTVLYHQEEGLWWAESPDLTGYGATGATLAEVRALVKDGLPFYLEDEDFELREQVEPVAGSAVIKIEYSVDQIQLQSPRWATPVVVVERARSTVLPFEGHASTAGILVS